MNPSDHAEALDGYLTCAIWSSSCNGQVDHDGCRGEDCDRSLRLAGFTPDDMGIAGLADAAIDVKHFLELLADEQIHWSQQMEAQQLGHDLWLTRNGHGAGFWDRGLGELGDLLTKWAKSMGSADLYVDGDEIDHIT